jgi:hypothetical protein
LNGFEPTISVDDLDAVIATVEGKDVGAMKYETPPRQ